MCQFAAAVARQIARLEANGDIHAGGQDRTSSRISHPGCNSDLRPPAIRNLARSVPIVAISRTGGNPNDSDHRLQQGSLDFDDDPGLDARRLVRGAMGQEGSPPFRRSTPFHRRPFRLRNPSKSYSIASAEWRNVSTR